MPSFISPKVFKVATPIKTSTEENIIPKEHVITNERGEKEGGRERERERERGEREREREGRERERERGRERGEREGERERGREGEGERGREREERYIIYTHAHVRVFAKEFESAPTWLKLLITLSAK